MIRAAISASTAYFRATVLIAPPLQLYQALSSSSIPIEDELAQRCDPHPGPAIPTSADDSASCTRNPLCFGLLDNEHCHVKQPPNTVDRHAPPINLRHAARGGTFPL
jgi:hypothetical protein